MSKWSKICELYILYGSTVIGHASIVSQDLIDKPKLWHLRIWHVTEKSLVELAKQELLENEN